MLSKRIKNNHGVILEVAALSALALIIIVVVLGLNTYFAKAASQELRLKVDQICENIANSPGVSPQDYIRLFQSQVEHAYVRNVDDLNSEVIGKYFKLKKARLISPTMTFQAADPFNINDGIETPYCSLGSPPAGTMSLSSYYTETGKWCSQGSNCDFIYDTAVIEHEYPNLFWNQSQNAGNHFACELKGDVYQFFSTTGKIEISAKSVMLRLPTGDYSDDGPDSTDIRSRPGLVVAVAPHMTTLPKVQRPSIPGGDVTFDDNMTSAQDRFRIAHSNLLGNNLLGYIPYTTNHTFNNANNTRSLQTPRPSRLVTDPYPSPPHSQIWQDFPYPLFPASVSPSLLFDVENDLAYAEKSLACMNIPTLIRNTFTSAILQLASRNGQLRSSTEFLLTGTKNTYSPKDASGNAVKTYNGPSIIVPVETDLTVAPPVERDLTKEDYRIPVIKYNSPGLIAPDILHATPPDPDDLPEAAVTPEFIPYEGEINGKYDTTSTLQEWRKYHSMISNQLRSCYYLYSYGLIEIPDLALDIFGADSTFENRLGTYNTNPSPAPSVAAIDKVKYSMPLNGFLNSTGALDQNLGLKSWEISSMIGTIQKCPISNYIFPSGPSSMLDACSRKNLMRQRHPNELNLDLTPDLIGLLVYLSRHLLTANFSPNTPSDSLGSSDPRVAPEWKPDEYFHPATASTIEGAPVVLVTHQSLTEQEKNEIKNLITSGIVPGQALTPTQSSALVNHWKKKRIIIIYIPVHSGVRPDFSTDKTEIQNALSTEISRFIEAFNVPVDPATNTSFNNAATPVIGNRLYVLSPDLDHNYDIYRPAGTSEDQAFRNYWIELMDPNSENYIIQKAINIYLSDVLTKEKRL